MKPSDLFEGPNSSLRKTADFHFNLGMKTALDIIGKYKTTPPKDIS